MDQSGLDRQRGTLPLSFCGGATSIRGFEQAGKTLGFGDHQISDIAFCSDRTGPFMFEDYHRIRRLLLKAARLQEKGN